MLSVQLVVVDWTTTSRKARRRVWQRTTRPKLRRAVSLLLPRLEGRLEEDHHPRALHLSKMMRLQKMHELQRMSVKC